MGRDWPRHPVSGESHRETGEGEREAQRPRQPAGACHVSPGRASSRAAPPPCLARLTRCARARTAPHSSRRVLIPGPDHSKLSRHAQLTPSVSLSARHPVSLGPNRPGCGPDDGADGQQRPGCHGTGPGPYLLRP